MIDITGGRLRPMGEGDVAAVMSVEVRAYPYPWTAGIFRDCVRVGYNCWVYEHAGRVRGYAVMSFGAGEAHLLNLCVDPDWQSHGLGRRMLGFVIEQATRLGADQMFLEVRPSNAPAVALYESAGFIEVGRRPGYYPADRGGREDALVMARPLFSDD